MFSMTPAVDPPPLDAQAWATAMHVLAVATVKRATAAGASLGVAAALGSRRSLGAATRYMLDAERGVITGTGKWRRVSAGAPDCDFCSMLIGRGAVYDADSVKFRSHDNCDCLPEIDL